MERLAIQLTPRDFAVTSDPIQSDYREICHRPLFLAAWKRRGAVFPLSPATQQGVGILACEGSIMQCDDLSPKSCILDRCSGKNWMVDALGYPIRGVGV
jgi:hypothetical protein